MLKSTTKNKIRGKKSIKKDFKRKSYAHFKLPALRDRVGEGGVRRKWVESEGAGWWKATREGGEWECS